MRDDPLVVALVARAGAGDETAWNEIVERYAPLVWAICCKYRLSQEDGHDVVQNVWLLLVAHVSSLREPAALPGWLATTTQRECLRLVRAASRRDQIGLPPDLQLAPDLDTPMIEEEILRAERNAALRLAFADLRSPCRELLSMLVSDPPLGYAKISAALGMSVGSIGPMRARCLKRLRHSPHLAALAEGFD